MGANASAMSVATTKPSTTSMADSIVITEASPDAILTAQPSEAATLVQPRLPYNAVSSHPIPRARQQTGKSAQKGFHVGVRVYFKYPTLAPRRKPIPERIGASTTSPCFWN